MQVLFLAADQLRPQHGLRGRACEQPPQPKGTASSSAATCFLAMPEGRRQVGEMSIAKPEHLCAVRGSQIERLPEAAEPHPLC